MKNNLIPLVYHPRTSIEDQQIREQRITNKFIKRYMHIKNIFVFDKRVMCIIGNQNAVSL